MIIECSECKQVNDLTSLGIMTGHVFDCASCNKQIRIHVGGTGQVSVLDSTGPDQWLEHAQRMDEIKQQSMNNLPRKEQ